jgi:hypothetical protein
MEEIKMAKLTAQELIDAIKELSVLELNDLVKACEEEFGVSAYTVITTGMIRSPLSAVLALNCFVNSTMFTPCCPSAGPTGGAGVALPAGICNLIYPSTFFAIVAPPIMW